MTKRKPSQFDSEQEKCLQKRGNHMVNNVSAGEKHASGTACKSAEMVKEDCLISEKGNPEGNEKDPEASVQSNDQSSADVPCILSTAEITMARMCEDSLIKDPNLYGKTEVFSKCRNADVGEHSYMISDIDSSSSEKPKIYKQYRRRVEKKSSKTEIVACPLLPVAQESTNVNTASLSDIAVVGGSSRKISDGTFIGDCSIPSVAKENDVLAEDACICSDKSNILDVHNSELKAVKSKSKGYEEIENKGKDEVLGFSQPSLELDRNNPSTTSLPSNGGVSALLGKEYVETTIESNPMMNADSQVVCMMKSEDATSHSESITLCVASSNSYAAIDFSIQTEVGKQLEQEKTISCSSCSTGHLLGGVLDSVSQVTSGDVVDDFHESTASKEAQRSRQMMMQPAVHDDRFCDDTSAINNGEVESHNVSCASDNLQEGNQKALSTCCRELPSPIRGLMHDSGTSDELNTKISLLDSFKDELSFSFPITEEVNIDKSYDDHSKKTRLCHEAVGSDDLVLIQKNDTVHGASPCIQEETINGQQKYELDSVAVSDTVEKALPSDLISAQKKEVEAGILEPGRSLLTPYKKKLLVLDLNGLLADIITDFRNIHKAQKVGRKSIFKRPFCDEFLDFCFEMFDVGVWSSRKGSNVDGAVNFLLGDNKHKLLFCWDQSKCTCTGFKTLENRHKPLVLKELKKLWNKEENDLPWEKGDYSPSNTLLVDDSPYKALCNPQHTAIFPEPYCFDDEKDNSLGPGGGLRVYLEGLAACNDVQQYVHENPFGQPAISTSDASWSFYLQIINKVEKSLAPTQ